MAFSAIAQAQMRRLPGIPGPLETQQFYANQGNEQSRLQLVRQQQQQQQAYQQQLIQQRQQEMYQQLMQQQKEDKQRQFSNLVTAHKMVDSADTPDHAYALAQAYQSQGIPIDPVAAREDNAANRRNETFKLLQKQAADNESIKSTREYNTLLHLISAQATGNVDVTPTEPDQGRFPPAGEAAFPQPPRNPNTLSVDGYDVTPRQKVGSSSAHETNLQSYVQWAMRNGQAANETDAAEKFYRIQRGDRVTGHVTELNSDGKPVSVAVEFLRDPSGAISYRKLQPYTPTPQFQLQGGSPGEGSLDASGFIGGTNAPLMNAQPPVNRGGTGERRVKWGTMD